MPGCCCMGRPIGTEPIGTEPIGTPAACGRATGGAATSTMKVPPTGTPGGMVAVKVPPPGPGNWIV